MISSENVKISEYHTSSRRVIQLITEIDSEISKNEEVLNFQREQYLNILKENKTKNNYLKILGMKMSIDELFHKIMSLSEMKIELVNKLSHSSEIFIEGLDDFLEKNLENTESTISKELEENEKKQEENKFENMESMQIIYSHVCGACKLLKNKLKMVKCSNEKCEFRWFHLKCMNLKFTPKETWLCSDSCYTEFTSSKPNNTIIIKL